MEGDSSRRGPLPPPEASDDIRIASVSKAYTQFVAATADGADSVSITVSAQISPKVSSQLFPGLRHAFELGVCAALAG